jgi:serine/threonine protein phosphatase PrpC
MHNDSLSYDAISFIGRRKENQDKVICLQYPQCDLSVFAVADGMGGHNGGELASRLVMEAIEQVSSEVCKEAGIDLNLKDLLTAIFINAQKGIQEAVKIDAAITGMGSTLTCLVIQGTRYVWGNIGDSRIYRFSDGLMAAITNDHSALDDYANETGKAVTEEMIRQFGNIITRCIDGGTDKPDIFPLNLEFLNLHPNEGFVLCSDGMLPMKSQKIEEFMVLTCLSMPDRMESACQQMISCAFQEGSSDNISIIFIGYGLKKMHVIQNQLMFPTVDNADRAVTVILTVKGLKGNYLIIIIMVCLMVIAGSSAFLLCSRHGAGDSPGPKLVPKDSLPLQEIPKLNPGDTVKLK